MVKLRNKSNFAFNNVVNCTDDDEVAGFNLKLEEAREDFCDEAFDSVQEISEIMKGGE